MKAHFDTQHYNFFLLALPFIVTVSVERICYNFLFICHLILVFEYSSHYTNSTQIPNVTLLIGIFNNGLSVSGSEISHEHISFVLDIGNCAFQHPLFLWFLRFFTSFPHLLTLGLLCFLLSLWSFKAGVCGSPSFCMISLGKLNQ